MGDKSNDLDNITMGWKHLPSIAELVYLPKSVFCDFIILDLLSHSKLCACSHKRWEDFRDPSTVGTHGNSMGPRVRIANLECIQSKELRNILACGLNHIPLCQTNLSKTMAKLLLAWSKISSLLKLDGEFTKNGTIWLNTFLWDELLRTARKNHGGFKLSHSGDLSSREIEEVRYLTTYFYIS